MKFLSPHPTLALVLALASPVQTVAETRPLNVLSTVGMIADIAGTVAGDCAEITSLLGSGSDPHMYRATASDVQRLSRAELILYVDPALEARLAEVLAGFSDRTPTLGLARATFDGSAFLADPDQSTQIDPHLWMDASRWARIAPVIADAIADQRPDCAPQMQLNVAELGAMLDALHSWIGAAIASIPEGQRMLVTAHDAFAYYSDAYGIEASEAIEGLSTESEASIGDIRDVAAFVVERRIPAVFVETTINPRTVEALVNEVRAQGHEVAIGGMLYSDAMGAPGTPGGSYIGMMWENTATIVSALGGNLPPLPDALMPWAAEAGIAP